MRLALYLAIALVAAATVPFRRSLDPVELRLTSAEDSSGYFLYSYEIYNPTTSSWSVAAVVLDVSASSGSPAPLPSTGDFRDLTDIAGYTVSPHAEVGAVIPAGWRGTLTSQATLRWYAPSGPRYTSDSIPPDSAMSGFGIRSSYYPGIADVTARPTFEACCAVPDTVEGEVTHPSPERFLVTSKAVLPRFMASEVDLALLVAQLDTVCDDPIWIDDRQLCVDLSAELITAETGVATGDRPAARDALERFAALIGPNTEPQGPIRMDAALLLRLNARRVMESVTP